MAISKLVSYPNKFLSIFFLRILPELLHLAILSACMFFKHYQIFAARRDYAAAIKNSTSKFYYRRKLAAAAAVEVFSDECSVCLSDYAEGEKCCRLTACGHAFHPRCVERWLMRGCVVPTCPLCRAAVVPEEAAEEYRRLQAEEDDWIEKEFALVLLNALDGGRCNNGYFLV